MELFKILGKIALDVSEALKGMKDTTEEAESTSSKVGAAFEKMGASALKVGKAMSVAMGAGAVALAALTKSALDAYAQYEQLVGGVETLFGDAQDAVMNYANEAYKTAGLSANQYMETVTSFSASLIQSLEGDTSAAAEVANQAIIDMSDNANKMGTSMEMIQNAYQGFAKQNYTMLDNLKLGYGGTQEEMKRLLADAQAISGIEYDISSYADVIDAIHVIQTEMGITGTTAKEASETISGSVSAMKASWANLVTGFGDENANLEELINKFVSSTTTAFGNILPRIEQILKGIATLVKEIVPQITSMLPGLIEEVLPPLLEATASLIQGLADAIPELLNLLLEVLPEFVDLGVEIIDSILDGILKNIGKMGTSATQIIVKLTTGIVQMLPKLLEIGVKLIVSIIQGITQSLPDIIDTIVDVVLQLADVLIENLPLFIEAGLELIVKLTEGVLEALPDLLEKMPEIIQKMVEALLNVIDLIIDAGVQLLTALVDNLPLIIETIVEVLPDIITAIVEALTSEDGIASIVDAGVELLTSIIDNIDDIIATVVEAIPALISGIFNALTSEDALSDMADAGIDMIYSVLEGLQDAWESVVEWAKKQVQWLADLFNIDIDVGVETTTTTSPGNNPNVIIDRMDKSDNRQYVGEKNYGKYAEGGVVPKGQIAFLEGYGTEAVVPLEKNKQWIGKVANDMDSALGGNGTAQKLDRLIALQEAMLEVMPELANISIKLNNRELGRVVRQVNA